MTGANGFPKVDFEPIPLTKAGAERASEVLTRAFVNDALLRYVCPEDDKRQERTRYIIDCVVSYGLRYGQVWTTPGDVRAVSICMPPGTDKMTLMRRIRTGMIWERFELGAAAAKRFNLFNSVAGEAHHRLMPGPHWYLFVIGVEPDLQGHGIGALMVRHMLVRADREELPVFLQAPNPAVIPFYQRLGFHVAGEVELPDGGLRVSSLIRHPGVKPPAL